MAQANGEDFMPGEGDVIGVVLAPINPSTGAINGQVTIAEVPFGCCILNVATADSTQTNPESDWVCVPIDRNPSMEIVKTGTWVDGNDDGYANVGEAINYSFAVSNTGNVTLTNVTVQDLYPGIVVNGGPTTLDVGETDSSGW